MRLAITALDDISPDLDEHLPVRGSIVRQIPASDRPDYYLARLDVPFVWKKEKRLIQHIIIAPRHVGGTISFGMRQLGVGIAYVIDDSLLTDESLDFAKCFYAAIGWADGEEESNQTPSQRGQPSVGDRSPRT